MATRYGARECRPSAPVPEIIIPAMGLPKEHPALRPVRVIPIDTCAFCGPIKRLMAVGNATKKAPFAMPFVAAKTRSGPMESEIGQIASILIAFGVIANNHVS